MANREKKITRNGRKADEEHARAEDPDCVRASVCRPFKLKDVLVPN